MANISSINGNPIVVGTDGIEDNSIPDAKLASDGIKATVSSLSADVATVADESYSYMQAVVSGGYPPESLFEKGGIAAGGGNSTYRAACRIRTKGIIRLPFDMTFSGELNTGMSYISFDSDGNIVQDVGSLVNIRSNPITLTTDYSYRLMFDGKQGQSAADMTVSEVYAKVIPAPDSVYTLEQVHSMLSDSSSLPSYYHDDDYIDGKALTVQRASAVDGISFGFISDVHTADSSLMSMKVAKYLADNTSAVPFMIFGGDVPTTQVGDEDGLDQQAMLWQRMMADYGKHRVYSCRGNHDYLGQWTDGGTSKSYGACRSYVMGYGPDGIVPGPDTTFTYYFDDKVSNTRFIVLDDYSSSGTGAFSSYVLISDADVHWLCDLLHDSDGMHVILVTHEPLNTYVEQSATAIKPQLSYVGDIVGAFAQKTTISTSYGATVVNEDFTQDTGVFVCALSGHGHIDYSSTSKGFLTIGITCDALYNTHDGYTKELGTVTQGAFDVISIDYTNRAIRCTRIGAGNDRQFTY